MNSTIPARLGTLPAGRLRERAVPAQLCLPSGAMPQMITRKSFHPNIMLPLLKIIYYPPWNILHANKLRFKECSNMAHSDSSSKKDY